MLPKVRAEGKDTDHHRLSESLNWRWIEQYILSQWWWRKCIKTFAKQHNNIREWWSTKRSKSDRYLWSGGDVYHHSNHGTSTKHQKGFEIVPFWPGSNKGIDTDTWYGHILSCPCTKEQRAEVLASFIFLTQKRDGQVKSMACINGNKKYSKISKESAASLTMMMNSIMISVNIEAFELQQVILLGIPSGFGWQHYYAVEGWACRVDCQVNPKLYRPFIITTLSCMCTWEILRNACCTAHYYFIWDLWEILRSLDLKVLTLLIVRVAWNQEFFLGPWNPVTVKEKLLLSRWHPYKWSKQLETKYFETEVSWF